MVMALRHPIKCTIDIPMTSPWLNNMV